MSPYAHAAADVDSSTCTINSAPPATATDKLSPGIEVACPSCGHQFRQHHQEEIKQESMRLLPGLPAGVRFDPNDAELLEHLEGKTRRDGEGRSHPLIDEFIPTLQGENGICCTHPEKLPGIKTNGEISHFFHRPSKAYTTGTRKRRKVESGGGGETRWHKTGKTRPILIDGVVRGQKKILVLYSNYGKQRKPEKTSWVMHQYHLGSHDDEKDGELVVSKVFYQTQPRQPASSLKDSKSMISSGLREGCHSSSGVCYEGGFAAQLLPNTDGYVLVLTSID